MSRPPGFPSHQGPPPSYNSYPPAHALTSRPEILAPGQHVRPRDPSGSQNNAQQLPSLRTLLEPELLDKKSSDPPVRSGSSQYAHGYDSASPTLKRRHDFDGYTHGYPEHNAVASQTPYLNRQPHHATTSSDAHSAASSTPGPVLGTSQIDMHRRSSFAYPSHNDQTSRSHRPHSTASDPAGIHANQAMQDEFGDASRPVRRRIDGSSRAPVRSSRCIGQRDMPGEGLCYIYEDGTYCRAIIDGEPVNPSWGITKAGKPRKRLAQACLTCREKKIKCEPGYPKCHQCAKSQRVCRGGLNQAGIGNASGETSPSTSAPLFKNSSTEVLNASASSDRSRAPGEPREYSKKIETWNAGTPYRPRNFRPTSIAPSRDMSVHSMDSDWSGSGNDQGVDDHRRGSYQDRLALQWEQDPYETDPRLTVHLLDLYFLHAGRATYGIFPRRPFIAWVESTREKNQDQLMLLYTVLAMGSLFSSDPDKRALGKRFAAVASYAAEKRFGRFTLQLCQSRLLLALYLFARGKSQEAWDFCGAGLRAISALKLNTEEGITELAESDPELDFGFDRWTYEECCRRTFWSGVLMDVSYEVTKPTTSPNLAQQQRYNGFFGGTLFVISMEDTYVRLPSPDDMYEASTPCEAPYFDEDLQGGSDLQHRLGYIAYLCIISAIWGDVLTFTGRAVRRPPSGYEQNYERFYARTSARLDAWVSMLPPNLHYTPRNLDKSIVDGYAGTFVSLHALYHATVIRLNRHVRVNAMPVEKLRRNVEHAVRHSSNFVLMMHSLASVNRQQRLPSSTTSSFLFSTPFPGYALMLSIDVLTSAGSFPTLANLIDTVGTAATCIDELASFWASARAQQKAVSSRLKQLADLALQEGQGVSSGTFGQFWKVNDSLETAFGNDDTIYKVEDQVLFDVVAQLAGR
ncbi:hypothetical protein FB567DRAFT_551991 [Paraphoma chrysanthemicola]|uniref:Zn(2)-C6 fungal-type domain-containing protein n=1 Tax=Paraphoma chrysanthemicola TaxID=798071 RepID=A0A8K0QZH5_9PLEO|nr:hypothetical protein FB567DRAFT_551991 [Paraphoma chrysanthemicola]